MRSGIWKLLLFGALFIGGSRGLKAQVHAAAFSNTDARHYLYVATPGIRDYLGFGGHGILVFNMLHNHRFVKRIPTRGLHPDGKPFNVKGIAVTPGYISPMRKNTS